MTFAAKDLKVTAAGQVIHAGKFVGQINLNAHGKRHLHTIAAHAPFSVGPAILDVTRKFHAVDLNECLAAALNGVA